MIWEVWGNWGIWGTIPIFRETRTDILHSRRRAFTSPPKSSNSPESAKSSKSHKPSKSPKSSESPKPPNPPHVRQNVLAIRSHSARAAAFLIFQTAALRIPSCYRCRFGPHTALCISLRAIAKQMLLAACLAGDPRARLLVEM